MTDKTPHPHFDDRGTLHWETTLAGARARAAADGRLVFVELGRTACSQCRALVEGVLPGTAVSSLMAEHFVGLAADADAPEPEVVELAQEHLAGATMLPFVFFLDAEGGFLDGLSGMVDPAAFQARVEALVASRG